MPRGTIDYSNTIIYKIICKDPSVKDFFVSHTTNFSQKKHSHKTNCTNSKKKDYNLQIYQTIRANGGWDNWEMLEIAKYNCKDANDARIKEYHHQLILNNELLLANVENIKNGEEKTDFEDKVQPLEQQCIEENQLISNTNPKPDFNFNFYTTSNDEGDEELNIDMEEITDRDIVMLTNLVLQLIKQNLFFKKIVFDQNKRIIELSKRLGIPVEEDTDDELENQNEIQEKKL
jgi:hypothetical protein